MAKICGWCGSAFVKGRCPGYCSEFHPEIKPRMTSKKRNEALKKLREDIKSKKVDSLDKALLRLRKIGFRSDVNVVLDAQPWSICIKYPHYVKDTRGRFERRGDVVGWGRSWREAVKTGITTWLRLYKE